MTDFLFLPIWSLLSMLVRQVENGIDNEPDAQDENDTKSDSALVLGTGEEDQYEPVAQIIKIGIVIFSLVLLGLSISAYRKTALRRILYAAVAFGLFAVQMLIDYLEDVVKSFETPFNDVVFLGITLAILALFFTAIVRRK